MAAVQRLAVGVYAKADGLKRAIQAALAELPHVQASLGEEWRGDSLYLTLAADGEEETVRMHVALALADHILSDLEPELLSRMIGQQYGHLERQERDSILAYADRNLSSTSDALDCRVERKAQIMSRLLDYLEGETEVNLEGFLRFRLRDYLETLEDAIDQAIDDYLLEKEYREFVRLLRYFVDAQEPRMERANVLYLQDGQFRLFDEHGQELENRVLRQFVMETLDTDITYEDLLISALITLAPRQVVIHDRYGRPDRESLETVAEVFADRLVFCPGCGLCRHPVSREKSGKHVRPPGG